MNEHNGFYLLPPKEELSHHHELRGSSSAVVKLRQEIDRHAQSHHNVLLIGEAHCGKNAVARMIHSLSSKSGYPFLELDCSHLNSPHIMHNSLEFVKKINPTTIHLQALHKLIFSSQLKMQAYFTNSSARIIASIDHSYDRMLKEGLLNKDLFNKIKATSIQLPAIKDRIDDIPEVVRHILEEANVIFRKNVIIETDALLALREHKYQNNFHELRLIIEHVVASAKASRVNQNDVRHSIEVVSQNKQSIGGKSLSDIERLALYETLKLCRGNKAAAARVLEISEKSIYNKMKRLGMRE